MNYTSINIAATGQKIKYYMEKNHLQVRDLQAYLGLATPQCIYHWFKGRNMPSVDNLYSLSELFRVPVDAMLEGNRKVHFTYKEEQQYTRLRFYYDTLFPHYRIATMT